MLARIFAFSIPFTIFSFSIAGARIEPAVILGTMLAALTFARIASKKWILDSNDRWGVWFLAFICTSAAFLPLSPYSDLALQKGVVQLFGITVLLLVAIAISRIFRESSGRAILPSLVTSLGFVAVIGVWQFLAMNLFKTTFLADFSFMNDMFLDGRVWRDAGYLGNIHRVNSINSEPAHFAQFLGMGLGIALVRIGALGRELRSSLESIVPMWAAIAIVVGVVISLSIIGYLLLFLVALFLFALVSRRTLLASKRVWMSAAISIVALWYSFSLSPTDDSILAKVQTLPLIYSSYTEGISSVATLSISSLALGANIQVALANLQENPILGGGIGSHPVAYEYQAPTWAALHQTLYALNAEDAGGLLIRLLSETGFLGLVLYIAGWGFLVHRARIAILTHASYSSRVSAGLAISIGMTASCVGLFIVYLGRMGLYYSPSIWVLFGCVAAVPLLLSDERQKSET